MMNKTTAIPLALLLAAASVHASALSVNPTTLYTFDTGNGTADAMGTQNLATAGSLTTSGLFGSAADAGGASAFRGATSTTNAADATNASWHTQPGTGDFSISFWYKAGAAAPTSYTQILYQGSVWAGGNNQTAGYGFEYTSAGALKFNYGDVTSSNARSTLVAAGNLNLSDWNHIALTRSGTEITLFLNGISSTQTATAGMDIAVNNANGEWYREFTLGKNTLGSGSLIGSAIDDVGLWRGAAITAGDVAQIYNGGGGSSLQSLIAAVPEPSAYGMMGAGALAAAALARRRRKRD